MSIDYALVQNTACDIATPRTFPPEYCPTCIIDPTAIPPSDWWNQTEPYLNKQTCEYYIPVSVNAEGKTFTTRDLKTINIPFNVFKYSYLRNGIRLALRHFEKIDDDNVVCAKIPAGEDVSSLLRKNWGRSKPHLYSDRLLWKHLGKFSKTTYFEDSEGKQFQIQEVRENLIERYSDITNPDALELFARVKDYHLGNGLEIIKMLVVIPAYVFDQVPENPMAAALGPITDDGEEEPEEKDPSAKLLTEVILDGYELEVNLKLMAAKFSSWGKFQALFFHTQNGRLNQRSMYNKEKQINFYIRKYKKPMEVFSQQLEQLLHKNDYRLTANKKNHRAAHKVRLTFKLPTATKPYRLTKVEAKYKGCDYKVLSKGQTAFYNAPQVKEPTLLNYVAKIEESIMVMQYMQSAPWVDWIQEYSYPPVEVNMLSNSMSISNVDDCIERPLKPTDMDDSFFDIDFDMKDALEWWSSQMNCRTLKSMENYDPQEHLAALQKQFTDMLKNAIQIDFKAIREMFGLPIDFKAMKGKSPVMIISDLFQKMKNCDIAILLFEILKCLFGGFSLDEAIDAIIWRTLSTAGILMFKIVYQNARPALQDKIASCAIEKLGGFSKTPWDYYDEKLKEADEDPYSDEFTKGQKYLVWMNGAGGPVDEEAAGLGQRAGLGGGENPPEPNIERVFKEWLTCFVDALEDIDWVLELIKDFPGAELLKTAVAFFGCPHQSFLKEFFAQLKGAVNFSALNPCNDLGGEFFTMPQIPKLPTLVWKELLTALLMILVKKIIDLIAAMLLKFIMKLLAQLSCEGLVDFIKGLGDGLGDEDNLLKAVEDSFCDTPSDNPPASPASPLLEDISGAADPSAPGYGLGGGPAAEPVPQRQAPEKPDEGGAYDNSKAMSTLITLMDEGGVIGPVSDIQKLAKDISACSGVNEFKKAFLASPNDQDPDFCSMISNIINDRHPRYDPVLGSPQQVANFFSNCGNYLTPKQKELIGASIVETGEDFPIDASVCITSADKQAWLSQKRDFINNLCGNLPVNGFRDGETPPEDRPDPRAPLTGPDGEPLIDPTTGLPFLKPLDDDGLTPEEVDDLGGLDEYDAGPAPTLGEDWLDKLAKRDESNLDETINMFLNGPAQGIADALEEAFKLTAPVCKYDPETGEQLDPEEIVGGGVMPPWPEEVTSMMDEAKKDMTNSIESAFTIDLHGGYHSFFNHLLTDKWNAPYSVGSRYRPSHETLTRHPWIAPNASDTEQQWQGRWDSVKDKTFSIQKLLMKRFAPDVDTDGNPLPTKTWFGMEFPDYSSAVFPSNIYPETIGIWMRKQLMDQIDPDGDDPLTFETNMGLYRTGGSFTVTPTRHDSEGNPRNNYRRHRWGLDKDVTYTFKRKAIPKAEMILKFRDNNSGLGGWDYGFDLKLINHTCDDDGNQLAIPAYRLVLDELESTNVASGTSWRVRQSSVDPETGDIELSGGIPSSIKYSRDRYMNVEVRVDPGPALPLIAEYSEASTSELSSYNFPGIVLKNYIKGIYSQAGLSISGVDSVLAKDLFDGLNNFVYTKCINMMMEDPNAEDGIPETFKFGYTNPRLSRADYTYISPNTEGYDSNDPETWEYAHDVTEKILGHSATKNPRVEFLDPEIHGGKYTKPKIYVKPPEYTGWLGIKQLILPEEDNHAPARRQFLFTDDIIKLEKDLREEIPADERLNDSRLCTQERAYDLLNSPTGHSGIHSNVLLTTRLYVFEHLLRTLSIYSIMKIDFTKNYDESILTAIVKDMEEEMSDIPRWGGRRGFFKRYRYWLLFLEQSVQTLERMLITKKIKKTPALNLLMAELADIRKQTIVLNKQDIKWMKFLRQVEWDNTGTITGMSYAYSRKVRGKRKYYPLSDRPSLEQEARLKHLLDSIMFYSFGPQFRSILSGETRNFAFRMRRRQRYFVKMVNKLYNIHNTKGFASTALRYIVANQLEFYGNKLNEITNDTDAEYPWRPKPYIDDLKKYFFGSGNVTLSGMVGGTTDEENAFREALKEAAKAEEDPPIFNYGADIQHVVHDPSTENPVDNFSGGQQAILLESPQGNLYLEKYLRIIEKPPTPNIPNDRQTVIAGRGSLLKGVVNIKEFQSWFKQNKNILYGTHDHEEGHQLQISDVFGDATPIFDETDPTKLISYNGSTGIKIGLRFCWVPSSDFDPDISTGDSAVRKEKSFAFKGADGYPDHNTSKIFPICSYERDITDRPLEELDLDDDSFGENLDCLIDPLLDSPGMHLLFNYCAPLRRAGSLMAVYCNYAFLPSIGEDSSERDNASAATPHNHWKGRVLIRSKQRLRYLFISNYRAVAWSTFVSKDQLKPREKARRSLKMKLEGNKKSRASRRAGWRRGRRIVSRPYDMYGEIEEPPDGVD